MRGGCLILAAVVGYVGLSQMKPHHPMKPADVSVARENTVKQACRDTTKMWITNVRDVGAQAMVINLKRPGYKAVCITQFDKVQSIMIDTLKAEIHR